MSGEVVVIVKRAPQICQECVDNSRHQSEQIGFVWCEHHMSGGMYWVDTGMWQISGPFQQEADFRRYCMAVVQNAVRKK